MAASKDSTDISDPSKFKLEADGSLKRPATVFRNVIEKGGTFEPEAGNYSHYIFPFAILTPASQDRYHLYVSTACRQYS